MDRSQSGALCKWKKSVSKGHIVYDSIYIAFSKQQNCRGHRQINGSHGIFVGAGLGETIIGVAWGNYSGRIVFIDCDCDYTNLCVW